jgi:hypothetical protein
MNAIRDDAVWDEDLDTFVHPVAALFPKLDEGSEDFRRLEASMSSMGQLDPIVYDGDVLLDGRHRLAVCRKFGMEPVTQQFAALSLQPIERLDSIQTVVAWIIAKNIVHRYLTEDQRVAIVAKAEAWELEAFEATQKGQFKKGWQGGPGRGQKMGTQDSVQPFLKKKRGKTTAEKIATKAKTSRYKAAQAIEIKKQAPELLSDVAKGKKTLNEATKTLPAKSKRQRNGLSFRDKVIRKLKKFLDSFGDEREEAIRIIKEQLQ